MYNVRRFMLLSMMLPSIAYAADLLRSGDRKEAKQAEEVIQVQATVAQSGKKKISQLTFEDQIRGFRNIVYHRHMPDALRNHTYAYLNEYGHLVATLKASHPHMQGIAGLLIAGDGSLVSATPDHIDFWYMPTPTGVHAPASSRVKGLVVHGGASYSLKTTLNAWEDVLGRQYGSALDPNMISSSLESMRQIVVCNGLCRLNDHIVLCSEKGMIEQIDIAAPAITTIVDPSTLIPGEAMDHAVLCALSADKRWMIVGLVDTTERSIMVIIDTKTRQVARRIDMLPTSEGATIQEILLHVKDPMILWDGLYYDATTDSVCKAGMKFNNKKILGKAALSQDRVACVDKRGVVNIFNRKTAERVGTIETKHASLLKCPVTDILELPNGHIATAGRDNLIKIWDDAYNPYRNTLEEIMAEEEAAAQAANVRKIKIAQIKGMVSKFVGRFSSDKKS